MNDLISRQAAIDAKMEFLNPNVKRDTKEQTEHDRVFAEGWNACNSHWIKEMENLPSAQPEITRCKDCEHWTNDDCPFAWGKVEDAFCSYAERRTDG